jgi:hypothetical protein
MYDVKAIVEMLQTQIDIIHFTPTILRHLPV